MKPEWDPARHLDWRSQDVEPDESASLPPAPMSGLKAAAGTVIANRASHGAPRVFDLAGGGAPNTKLFGRGGDNASKALTWTSMLLQKQTRHMRRSTQLAKWILRNQVQPVSRGAGRGRRGGEGEEGRGRAGVLADSQGREERGRRGGGEGTM